MPEATIGQTRKQRDTAISELTTEQGALRRELARLSARLGKLGGNEDAKSVREVVEVQDRIRLAEQRAAAIAAELATLNATSIDDKDVRRALQSFGGMAGGNG